MSYPIDYEGLNISMFIRTDEQLFYTTFESFIQYYIEAIH